MNPGVRKPTREEVLDAFAVEPQHDRTVLERYLKQYPEYASELVELSREVSRNIGTDQNPLSAHESRLIDNAWHHHAPIETKSGTDPLAVLSVQQSRDIAKKLDVPRQIITAFKERRVRVETVPKPFLAALAEALEFSIEALVSSLSYPSVPKMARSYKAEVKPSVGAAVSFEQLLVDAGVSESRRAELMAKGA
ncbi:hypothetical protein GCM10007972_24000 [Iodidimonas muriae]|uniref:XRE family transcriptional regulator n=1 Tax=Iodidimonas muriae TaxID=261467 RepID=A0ABQ2LFI9_9PROT|nr:hypothetical protein [Iodidimonas muriae]GER08778.1 hypothetical protein JCM17843_30880 [Kordiimonadales bacterium JCM 17843]GGO15662.1 hypothetical protein GCM10007972_24000 [Iodidimonas muriae]